VCLVVIIAALRFDQFRQRDSCSTATDCSRSTLWKTAPRRVRQIQPAKTRNSNEFKPLSGSRFYSHERSNHRLSRIRFISGTRSGSGSVEGLSSCAGFSQSRCSIPGTQNCRGMSLSAKNSNEMKRSNVKFVVGFDHRGSPKVLYAGLSLKDAEFAESVALQSNAYHRVNLYANPIITKSVDFTESTL
jgi:hypothetical protein